MQVKSFSISWERDKFLLKLICLSPSGKEKISKIYFTLPVLEQFVAYVKKAIDHQKSGIPPEKDVSYIG